MAYKFKKYDEDKKQKGAWVNIGGGKFKVSSVDSAAFTKMGEEIRKRNDQYEGAVPPDVSARDNAELVAETLLQDWDDMVAFDENGEETPVPFTRSNAFELILNDTDLGYRIVSEAKKLSNYEKDRVKKEAKKQ